MAGCATDETDLHLSTPAPEPSMEVVGVDALELLSVAQMTAKDWNEAAQLTLVAAFEGDPDLAFSGARSNRWSSNAWTEAGPMADGLATAWSFTFTPVLADTDPATQACEQGIHLEARLSYVVIVDETGRVVTDYETTNDDEGGPTTAPLRDPAISSAEAAAIAQAQAGLADQAAASAWSQTFLMAGWYTTDAAWTFLTYTEDGRNHAVAVDAATGQVVINGGRPPAKC